MTRNPMLPLAMFALVAIPMALHAAGKSTFTAADINRVAELSNPELSPDGNRVLYTVTQADMSRDQQHSTLWRVDIDGQHRRQLTHTPNADAWSGEWSRDGKVIAFLSDRKSADGKDVGKQVWEMSADGGNARQLTHFPAGVKVFELSPDGNRLAVIALDPKAPAANTKSKTPPPFVTTRFHFKNDEQGWLGYRYQHLYVVDIARGKASLLTPGKRNQYLPSWSPDGQQIAYVSKGGPHPDRTMDYQIYLVDAHPGAKPHQLTTDGDNLDPYWGSIPSWSPNGRSIAYLHSLGGKWADYAPSRLAVIDISSGEHRVLTSLDRTFYHPTWTSDGRAIYALLEQAEVTHLVSVDPATDALTEMDHGDRFDLNLTASPNGRIVVLGGDDLHPYNLAVLDHGRLRVIADHNRWLADTGLTATETLHFTDPDGVRIDALLMKPLHYAKGRRYPTILLVHGGPVYQFSHEFHDDWQVYAANGYAVLAVNPRGSSGRGFEFAKAIYADWGNKDTQDLMAGVDDIVKLGIADPDRMGIGGWSYGAILTDQVIARTQRFKTAIVGAGSGNMYGMYGVDEYALDYQIELGLPWNPGDRAAWDRVSYPFLHADRIVTPTLFECDGIDFNVPCVGSEQMYQALREIGIPTELVVYPAEHHEISTPSYLLDRMQRDLAWFDRYLKHQGGTQ